MTVTTLGGPGDPEDRTPGRSRRAPRAPTRSSVVNNGPSDAARRSRHGHPARRPDLRLDGRPDRHLDVLGGRPAGHLHAGRRRCRWARRRPSASSSTVDPAAGAGTFLNTATVRLARRRTRTSPTTSTSTTRRSARSPTWRSTRRTAARRRRARRRLDAAGVQPRSVGDDRADHGLRRPARRGHLRLRGRHRLGLLGRRPGGHLHERDGHAPAARPARPRSRTPITLTAHVAADAGPSIILNQASVDGPQADPDLTNNDAEDPVVVRDVADVSVVKAVTEPRVLPGRHRRHLHADRGQRRAVRRRRPARRRHAPARDDRRERERDRAGRARSRDRARLRPADAGRTRRPGDARHERDHGDRADRLGGRRRHRPDQHRRRRHVHDRPGPGQQHRRRDHHRERRGRPRDHQDAPRRPGGRRAAARRSRSSSPTTGRPTRSRRSRSPTRCRPGSPTSRRRARGPARRTVPRTTVVCDLDDVTSLAAGATAPDLVVTALDRPGARTRSVVNTRPSTRRRPTPCPSNNAARDPVLVTQSADVRIAKTHTGAVRVGDDVTFHLTVFNKGPSDARDVVVTDPLPAGLTYVSAAGTDWTCGTVLRVVRCTYDVPLPADRFAPQIDLVTTVGPEAFPSVRNVADVDTSTEGDNRGDNVATDDVGVPAAGRPVDHQDPRRRLRGGPRRHLDARRRECRPDGRPGSGDRHRHAAGGDDVRVGHRPGRHVHRRRPGRHLHDRGRRDDGDARDHHARRLGRPRPCRRSRTWRSSARRARTSTRPTTPRPTWCP